jgi:hypothetical protein
LKPNRFRRAQSHFERAGFDFDALKVFPEAPKASSSAPNPIARARRDFGRAEIHSCEPETVFGAPDPLFKVKGSISTVWSRAGPAEDTLGGGARPSRHGAAFASAGRGPPRSNPTLGRLVAWVVANRPEGERFGPKLVAHEITRRFPKALRRRVDPPAVSIVLRRMSAARRIHQVREGKPNHEALYTRGPQPPAAKRDDDR